MTSNPAAIAEYESLFDVAMPVDYAVASAAFLLKRDSPERLPAMDALIAACAKLQDAALVHRDSHISSIPNHLRKQELLPPKT